MLIHQSKLVSLFCLTLATCIALDASRKCLLATTFSPVSQKLCLYLQAIDTLALNLQNKWVFPPCLAFAKQGMQSNSPDVRAAACTVLVVVAEGCCDACTSHLAQVLQVTAADYTCSLAKACLLRCMHSAVGDGGGLLL